MNIRKHIGINDYLKVLIVTIVLVFPFNSLIFAQDTANTDSELLESLFNSTTNETTEEADTSVSTTSNPTTNLLTTTAATETTSNTPSIISSTILITTTEQSIATTSKSPQKNLTYKPMTQYASTTPGIKSELKHTDGPGPVIITLLLIACLTIVAVIGFFVFNRLRRRIRGRNYFRQLDQYQDDLLDYEIGIDTNTSNFVLDDMDDPDNVHYSSRPHLA